mmetsp:Transcript_87796/g.249904  ORF Transcript_87796/g.249904 Transcript_87796/m.249904 type:complete len:321 (+) Transcript_87796:365-1327(+)
MGGGSSLSLSSCEGPPNSASSMALALASRVSDSASRAMSNSLMAASSSCPLPPSTYSSSASTFSGSSPPPCSPKQFKKHFIRNARSSRMFPLPRPPSRSLPPSSRAAASLRDAFRGSTRPIPKRFGSFFADSGPDTMARWPVASTLRKFVPLRAALASVTTAGVRSASSPAILASASAADSSTSRPCSTECSFLPVRVAKAAASLSAMRLSIAAIRRMRLSISAMPSSSTFSALSAFSAFSASVLASILSSVSRSHLSSSVSSSLSVGDPACDPAGEPALAPGSMRLGFIRTFMSDSSSSSATFCCSALPLKEGDSALAQ